MEEEKKKEVHSTGRPEIGRPAFSVNPEPAKKSDEPRPEAADDSKE